MRHRWLAHVEISTHNQHFRPLWAVPQFKIKTFKPHLEPVPVPPREGGDLTSASVLASVSRLPFTEPSPHQREDLLEMYVYGRCIADAVCTLTVSAGRWDGRK